jgi:hypothetical protein
MASDEQLAICPMMDDKKTTIIYKTAVDSTETSEISTAAAKLSGFILRMFDTIPDDGTPINFSEFTIGFEELSQYDVMRFMGVWQYFADTPAGTQLAEKISPEYLKENTLGDKIKALVSPVEGERYAHEASLHKSMHEMLSNEDPNKRDNTLKHIKTLVDKFISLKVLIVYCNLANFLHIEPCIKLYAHIITKYMVIYSKAKLGYY